MSRIAIFIIICLLASCQSEYDRDLQQWKNQRFHELKDPYGWPSVIGLFPIKVSYSYFGRSEGNEFLIPNGPSSFGFLQKTDSTILMKIYKNVPVFVDSQRVREVVMKSDLHPDGPTIASHKSLQWHIIERDSQPFLRVKDSLSSYRSALVSVPYFPVNKEEVIEAKVIQSGDRPTQITYQNILGQNIERKVAAYLSFEKDGQTHEIVAFENDETSYFVMIKDNTSANSTYGGGRYLYPEKENKEGFVILDFNKLINPPCVFTPFATCPLPPKSNHLPFDILAGEKEMHLY